LQVFIFIKAVIKVVCHELFIAAPETPDEVTIKICGHTFFRNETFELLPSYDLTCMDSPLLITISVNKS
jgi:hypothetical protein